MNYSVPVDRFSIYLAVWQSLPKFSDIYISNCGISQGEPLEVCEFLSSGNIAELFTAVNAEFSKFGKSSQIIDVRKAHAVYEAEFT